MFFRAGSLCHPTYDSQGKELIIMRSARESSNPGGGGGSHFYGTLLQFLRDSSQASPWFFLGERLEVRIFRPCLDIHFTMQCFLDPGRGNFWQRKSWDGNIRGENFWKDIHMEWFTVHHKPVSFFGNSPRYTCQGGGLSSFVDFARHPLFQNYAKTIG